MQPLFSSHTCMMVAPRSPIQVRHHVDKSGILCRIKQDHERSSCRPDDTGRCTGIGLVSDKLLGVCSLLVAWATDSSLPEK